MAFSTGCPFIGAIERFDGVRLDSRHGIPARRESGILGPLLATCGPGGNPSNLSDANGARARLEGDANFFDAVAHLADATDPLDELHLERADAGNEQIRRFGRSG